MLRWSARQDMADLELAERLERFDDDAFLLLGIWVVDWDGEERGDDVFAFGRLTGRKEIARRLGELEDAVDDDNSEDDLEGDGNAPAGRVVDE